MCVVVRVFGRARVWSRVCVVVRVCGRARVRACVRACCIHVNLFVLARVYPQWTRLCPFGHAPDSMGCATIASGSLLFEALGKQDVGWV